MNFTQGYGLEGLVKLSIGYFGLFLLGGLEVELFPAPGGGGTYSQWHVLPKLGMRAELFSHSTLRFYLQGLGALGYGMDPVMANYGFAMAALGDLGASVGDPHGFSFTAHYRFLWMQSGAWLGTAHQIWAGLQFGLRKR